MTQHSLAGGDQVGLWFVVVVNCSTGDARDREDCRMCVSSLFEQSENNFCIVWYRGSSETEYQNRGYKNARKGSS